MRRDPWPICVALLPLVWPVLNITDEDAAPGLSKLSAQIILKWPFDIRSYLYVAMSLLMVSGPDSQAHDHNTTMGIITHLLIGATCIVLVFPLSSTLFKLIVAMVDDNLAITRSHK